MDDKKVIEAALRAAAQGTTRRYDLNIPGVISLKADGPEDHARALESIGLLKDLLPRVLPPAPMPAKPPGPMLHAAIDRFLKDFRASGRAEATLVETTHTLAMFRALVTDVPVGEFSVEHLDHFRDCLALWPARARAMPEFKGLTASAVIAKAKGKGLPGLSVRTVEKHLDRLRVFFNALVRRGELVRNPLSGVRLQTAAAKYAVKRRGFEPHELAALFGQARVATRWRLRQR